MAFCTSCGASVTGAFCNQCGTPAGPPKPPSAAAPPPVYGQPAPPAAYGQAAPPMAPVKRGTSPLVWVLVIVLGIFVLGAVAVVGTGFFVVHKARQAGLDTNLMQRNPGLAAAKLITTMNPDTEIVKTDESAGTITVRDRKTGKVTTLSFDDARNGKFNMKIQGDDGNATVEIGAGGKLPSWVPAYPGSTAKGTFSMKGGSNDGSGEGGNFTFTTADSASQVLSFYQQKTKDMGMKANLTTNSDDGGMLIVADEASQRTLTIVVAKGSPETTVNITYAEKR